MRPTLVLAAIAAAVVLVGRTTVGVSGTVTSASADVMTWQHASLQVSRLRPVPLVRQAYHNNCETAALSMVLAAAGVDVDQQTLQLQLPRSGPLDPVIATDGSWTWGNPDTGFVGRVRGGGVAGGFGVYQGPIRRLAERYHVRLDDLSRHPSAELFERLAQGRPVLAWIGLSEGPYRRWQTPDGKPISVNFGEHAVVLTAIHGDSILANDPLTGSRRTWTREQFLGKWQLLGRRALAL